MTAHGRWPTHRRYWEIRRRCQAFIALLSGVLVDSVYIYIYKYVYIYTYIYIHIYVYRYCCRSLTVKDPAAVPERHCQIFMQPSLSIMKIPAYTDSIASYNEQSTMVFLMIHMIFRVLVKTTCGCTSGF